jgi:hypothetical protein
MEISSVGIKGNFRYAATIKEMNAPTMNKSP